MKKKGITNLLHPRKSSENDLWTDRAKTNITVYNRPIAYFEFDNEMNEDTWVDFNASKSTGLELNYIWILDGNILDSNNAVISTYIDSGAIMS